eukprot:m.56678 g.56678  ORF g.56678 m.56678 type:complete len:364 (+) comp11052_c0_seq2:370-1461(+)
MKRLFHSRDKALKTSFTLDDFEGDGMSWAGKYIGTVPMTQHTGREPPPKGVCEAAMKDAQGKLKSGKFNQGVKKKRKVFTRVSIEGVANIDLSSGTFVSKNPVHRILGWYPDPKKKDIVGIITKGEGALSGPRDTFCCIVLKSSQAVSILAALKQLMAIVFTHASSEPVEQRDSGPVVNTTTGTWKCGECNYGNALDSNECVMCGWNKNAPPPGAMGESTGVGEIMTIVAEGADDNEVAPAVIEAFIGSHNPEVKPDYINLPRGIEAIELAKESDNPDYVNLGSIVQESEEYIKRAAVVQDKKAEAEPSAASSKDGGQWSSTNPFANLSSDEGEMDDGDADDLDALWGREKTENPHNPFNFET